MGIDQINRFHWAMIGALLGALMGYVWTSSAQSPRGMGDQAAFERDVVRTDEAGNPLVRRIVIHPARPDFRGRQVTLITYERLTERVWSSGHFYTGAPYKPIARHIGREDQGLTVASYLDELVKQSPRWEFVTYSNGWSTEPRNAAMVGAGMGLLILGGIWPILLNLMLAKGWGPKDKVTGESLWRVRSRASSATNKLQLSQADEQRIRDVADAYEKAVGSECAPTGAAVEGTDAPTDPEVCELENKTLQELPRFKQSGEDDEVELKGEFYPVIMRQKKNTQRAQELKR
jgi:hypothetical protein